MRNFTKTIIHLAVNNTGFGVSPDDTRGGGIGRRSWQTNSMFRASLDVAEGAVYARCKSLPALLQSPVLLNAFMCLVGKTGLKKHSVLIVRVLFLCCL